MIKILIIDNSQGITGAFKTIFQVAGSLQNEFEFHFATPAGNHQLSALIKQQGLNHKQINFIEINRRWNVILYLPMLLINSWRLLQYIKKNTISVVHVNDLYNMTGVVIKKMHPSVKLVCHVRLLSGSYAGLFYPSWVKIIGKTSDQIIAVSESVRKEVVKYTNTKKVSRIYDFLNLEEKWPCEQRNDQLVKFFYPANFTPGKGHEYAIRSFRKALALNSSIRLTFSGSDFGLKKNIAYKQKLLREASDLINQGYVTFTDGVSDMEKVMKQHDVVLNFSESESFSMTCYEANYYKLPVVVTDCGGPTEFVEHEISGWIVPRGDIEAMSHAIVTLANNGERRKLMGQQARTLLEKKINSENTLARYKMIYKSWPDLNNRGYIEGR